MSGLPASLLHNADTRTTREFKAKKRRELRAALRELETLRLGCHYMPGTGENVIVAINALRRQLEACSAKRWGR